MMEIFLSRSIPVNSAYWLHIPSEQEDDMLGIFANVFKRATYQDEQELHRDLRGDFRPPFHLSQQTRRQNGWRGDHDD